MRARGVEPLMRRVCDRYNAGRVEQQLNWWASLSEPGHLRAAGMLSVRQKCAHQAREMLAGQVRLANWPRVSLALVPYARGLVERIERFAGHLFNRFPRRVLKIRTRPPSIQSIASAIGPPNERLFTEEPLR